MSIARIKLLCVNEAIEWNIWARKSAKKNQEGATTKNICIQNVQTRIQIQQQKLISVTNINWQQNELNLYFTTSKPHTHS